MDVLRLQNLFEVRIVGCDQRTGLQLCQVVRHPDGDHRGGDEGILQDAGGEVQIAAGIGEVRLDPPKHVPAAREDHPAAYDREAALVALQVAREQQGEGNDPVEDEIQRDDYAPVTA